MGTILLPTGPANDTSVSQGTLPPPPMDLDTMYQQLLGLTRARDWRSAVSLAAQILARDANYRDVSAILASASNELRFGRGSTSVQLEFQNVMAEVDSATRAGRLMEAAAMLQQLLRTSPNSPSARSKLEQVNRMMADVETQRRRLSRLDQLYSLAQSKMASNDLRWALHILEELAAQDRNYRDVEDLIARIRTEIDPEVPTIAPATRVTSLREQAEAAMAQNRWSEAVEAYEEILRLEPNFAGIKERLEEARHQATVTTLNAEVAKLAAEGHLEEAIKKLEEIKKLTRT
jgi:tetratricopeptide (TPR) repeat protein